MSAGNHLLPKGLFGGLLSELKLNEVGLLSHISSIWTAGNVKSVIDVEEWRRGGAETYVAVSLLQLTDGSLLKVIGKAFVGMGLSPTEQQERWEARRILLRNNHINTPNVYATYPGMVIEEFIDAELGSTEILSNGSAFQLGQVSQVVHALGFQPVALTGDIRVKDGRLFVIDFGSDLGGSGSGTDESWLERLRRQLSVASRASFDHGFMAGARPQ